MKNILLISDSPKLSFYQLMQPLYLSHLIKTSHEFSKRTTEKNDYTMCVFTTIKIWIRCNQWTFCTGGKSGLDEKENLTFSLKLSFMKSLSFDNDLSLADSRSRLTIRLFSCLSVSLIISLLSDNELWSSCGLHHDRHLLTELNDF